MNVPGELVKRAKELAMLPNDELRVRGEKGKNVKEQREEEEIAEIRKKYGVK
jgi:hypothetical protein